MHLYRLKPYKALGLACSTEPTVFSSLCANSFPPATSDVSECQQVPPAPRFESSTHDHETRTSRNRNRINARRVMFLRGGPHTHRIVDFPQRAPRETSAHFQRDRAIAMTSRSIGTLPTVAPSQILDSIHGAIW